MKRGKVLEGISISLFLLIVILFVLNYNTNNIVVDKNHYYCPNVVGMDLKGNVISNDSSYCSEIEWTLMNVLMDSPTLKYIFLYGIPILSLILILISFIVLFTEDKWPMKVSKTILIIILFFGLLSSIMIMMWVGGFSILLLFWFIILLITGSLIIKFDKKKKSMVKRVIMILLSVVVYSIIILLTFLITSLPYAIS